MKWAHHSYKLFLPVILCYFSVAVSIKAQNPRERTYLYPVLTPAHNEKQQIYSWAQSRIKEPLNRGIMATKTSKGAYISWRLLEDEPQNTGFNIYRLIDGEKKTKLNKQPITNTTDFTDIYNEGKTNVYYQVVPVISGKEDKSMSETALLGSYCKTIKLQGKYTPNKIAVADLNGDGNYDYIIKQPGSSIDPGKKPDTTGTTYKIEAYLNDGTFLWRKDLGLGIEPGIWYSPFIAYDFNGDGKAEIALKTSMETSRNENGRVVSGTEYISIWDGLTGKELSKSEWPKRSPRYGDYNRNNRNQIGLAFLDGKTPCLLVARGTYRLMVLDAYQFHNNKLEKLWRWDGDEENPIIRHQGAHGMHCADVDADGRDEVILGSVVIDDNGTALWSTGYGHPDKCFVSDIDPSRPGMEIFYAIEDWNDNGNGVCLVDAKTGETIWGIGHKTYHVGDGMVADIIAEEPGLECFASEDPKGGSHDKYLLSAKGKYLSKNDKVPPCRNWIYWDGDLLRETLTGGTKKSPQPINIKKYEGKTLTKGIEGKILMMADLFGDWREELVVAKPGELLIYTTQIPASDKRVTLMQDPVYRIEVAHRSMGYEQSPVTSYYLGLN